MKNYHVIHCVIRRILRLLIVGEFNHSPGDSLLNIIIKKILIKYQCTNSWKKIPNPSKKKHNTKLSWVGIRQYRFHFLCGNSLLQNFCCFYLWFEQIYFECLSCLYGFYVHFCQYCFLKQYSLQFDTRGQPFCWFSPVVNINDMILHNIKTKRTIWKTYFVLHFHNTRVIILQKKTQSVILKNCNTSTFIEQVFLHCPFCI